MLEKTGAQQVTNRLLYQLSYVGFWFAINQLGGIWDFFISHPISHEPLSIGMSCQSRCRWSRVTSPEYHVIITGEHSVSPRPIRFPSPYIRIRTARRALEMAIIDLFSKRQKVLRDEVPDVYEYAQIPQELRVQIAHILRDLFGHWMPNDANGCIAAFTTIEQLLCREYGLFQFPSPPDAFLEEHADQRVIHFVLVEPNHERVLDVIEVSFRCLDVLRTRNYEWQRQVPQAKFDGAIEELNARFREHGIGYQFESGEIIRVDSQLIHAEVVKPALALLTAPEYAGANAEFLKAFENYRKGDTKGCLNECLKAFESTMKAICTKRKWTFKSTDTAKPLLDVCFQNNLIPQLIQSHIGGVRAALESGIPTIRNRLSGHGQGAQVVNVPEHYASYMLHLTATTIKYLVESEKALP